MPRPALSSRRDAGHRQRGQTAPSPSWMVALAWLAVGIPIAIGRVGDAQAGRQALRPGVSAIGEMERANGFEPSTCTLARYRSTN